MRNEREYHKYVAEYERVEAMTNEEVIKEFNCDEDEENAKSYILEDIQSYIDWFGYEEPEISDGLDPAFDSWEEVNRMFYSPI